MAKITLLTISRLPPKTLETKSYLKKPIKPQFTAPMIINIRAKFLTDITPFSYYYAHFYKIYVIMNAIRT
jgi:hypothetical protein